MAHLIFQQESLKLAKEIKDANFDGIMIDIQEDEGIDRAEIVLFAVEHIIKDVQDFIQSGTLREDGWSNRDGDKDILYALVNLVQQCTGEELFSFLPRDNHMYKPSLTGKYRLESYEEGILKEVKDNE